MTTIIPIKTLPVTFTGAPMTFIGTPTLTPEKVDLIKTWYVDILGKHDKITDVSGRAYHAGAVNILSDTLRLLHDNPVQNKPLTETVVKVVKSNKWSIKKKLIVVAVVIIVIDGTLPRKIKSILEKKIPVEKTKEKN